MHLAESLPYQSRSKTAANALRKAIVASELKPGERLIELQLATQFRIGQPTIREALKELEYQGLVRRFPNRGTYVINLKAEDFRKIHEIRMCLEPKAFELAARNLTADSAQRLAGIVESMEGAALALDRVGFHNSDIEFHRTVWRLAGNEYIEMALERILFGMFAAVLSRQQQPAFLKAVQQHRDNLKGLLTGKPDKARLCFIKSANEFWKTYCQIDSARRGMK